MCGGCLPGCPAGIPRVSGGHHACYGCVSRLVPAGIMPAFRLYHACYRFASRVLSACITHVTGLHHAYFPSASRVLPICITRERVLTSRVFWFVNRRDVRWTSRVMSDSRWRDVRHTPTVPLPDPCCGSSHTAATFRQPEGRSVAESHFFPLSLPRENV